MDFDPMGTRPREGKEHDRAGEVAWLRRGSGLTAAEVVAIGSESNGYDLAREEDRAELGQGWLWRRSWLLDLNPTATTSRERRSSR